MKIQPSAGFRQNCDMMKKPRMVGFFHQTAYMSSMIAGRLRYRIASSEFCPSLTDTAAQQTQTNLASADKTEQDAADRCCTASAIRLMSKNRAALIKRPALIRGRPLPPWF